MKRYTIQVVIDWKNEISPKIKYTYANDKVLSGISYNLFIKS